MMKHKHHIVPRHMGGSDHPSNLIELTIEEHAEAHRILFEKYGRKEDELAWKGLAGIIPHKKVVAEAIRYGQTKPRYFSPESRARIAENNRTRKITAEHRRKTSLSMRGNKNGLKNKNESVNDNNE